MGPLHPGEVLREEFLEPLGIGVAELALELGANAEAVGQVVHECSAVDAQLALRLARYLGTSPEFWLNLQKRFDLDVAAARWGDEIARTVRERPAD